MPSTDKSEVNIKIHLDPIPVYHPKFHELVVEKVDEDKLKLVFDKVNSFTLFDHTILAAFIFNRVFV